MLLIFLPCGKHVLKYWAIGRHSRAAEPCVSNRTEHVSIGKVIAVMGAYSVGAATRKWYSDGDICCSSVCLRQLGFYSTERMDETYSLSMKPGMFELPPTTTTFASIAGRRSAGKVLMLCIITDGNPASFIPISPGLKSNSGTVNLSFFKVSTGSRAAPVAFLFAASGSCVRTIPR